MPKTLLNFPSFHWMPDVKTAVHDCSMCTNLSQPNVFSKSRLPSISARLLSKDSVDICHLFSYKTVFPSTVGENFVETHQ